MAFVSHTHGLGVLCVVLIIVASGRKLQFVLRVFLLKFIKVKFTVKCITMLQLEHQSVCNDVMNL